MLWPDPKSTAVNARAKSIDRHHDDEQLDVVNPEGILFRSRSRGSSRTRNSGLSSSILSGLLERGPKLRGYWRFHLVSAVLMWFGGAAAAAGAERFIDFRQLKVNEPPPGFRST